MGSDLVAEKSEDLPAGSDSADEVGPNRGATAGDCPSTGEPEVLSLPRIPSGPQGRKLMLPEGTGAHHSGRKMPLQEQAPHPEKDFSRPSDAQEAAFQAGPDKARPGAGPSVDSLIGSGQAPHRARAHRAKALCTLPEFQVYRAETKLVSCPQRACIPVHGPVSGRIRWRDCR